VAFEGYSGSDGTVTSVPVRGSSRKLRAAVIMFRMLPS
jgi:hypothetical protein